MRNVSRSGEKGKSHELQVRCRCESCVCGFTGPQIPAGFESARILSDSRDRATLWDCRSEAESLIKKGKENKSCTNRKPVASFPFWRERGTGERRWKVERCMWINGNNGNMLHFFRCMKTQDGKRKVCETKLLSWKKGWTIRFNEWWIVDYYMLEHRKEQKCSI